MRAAEAAIITPEGTPSSLRVTAIRNASRSERELEVICIVHSIVNFNIDASALALSHSAAYLDVLRKYEPRRWSELLAYEAINRGHSATLRQAVDAAPAEPWLEQALAACLQRGTVQPGDAEYVAAAIRAPSRRLQNYLRRSEHPNAAALRAILGL